MADRSIERLVQCIKDTHIGFFSSISGTVENNMEKFTDELFARKLISGGVRRSQNYSKVTNEFWAGLPFQRDIKGIEDKCKAFLNSLAVSGPNGAQAAKTLAEGWKERVRTALGINSFLSDFTVDGYEAIDGPRLTQAPPPPPVPKVPYDEVIKKHTPRLLQLVTDPDTLAVELWAGDFIGDTMKDTILTTNLSNMAKGTKLLHEVYVYFQDCDDRKKMEEFCSIMKKTCNPGIERLVNEILSQI